MAKWSREKVNSENINGGNQYEKKDRVTLEQLNAMVNSGLYSQDFAEHLADAPDISQANTVGAAKVEFVDNVVGGKTYKKFKFSNLKGNKGDKGDKGDKGNTGAIPVITATATTLPAGSSATVTKSGTAENPTLAFGIPKGDKGDTGASAGFGTPTATIDSNVGTPSVTVTASGSDTSKVFNFAFKNLKGEKGDTGNTGATGATPNISVSATTLPAGSSATATISGSAESPTITFGIPKGDRGESGLIYQSTGTNTDGAMSQKATTDELTAIITTLSNKFTNHPQSAYDCNACYDEGVYLIANGSNCPSGSQYGSLFVMPYRKPTGNTKPDYCTQIYLPNGDDSTAPNSMFYRTSLENSWNAWQEVATTSQIPTKTSQLTNDSSFATTSQIPDISGKANLSGGNAFTGTQTIDGKTALCVDSFNNSTTNGYIRFTNGLQICYGSVYFSANGHSGITFGKAFVDTNYIIAEGIRRPDDDDWDNDMIGYDKTSKTGCALYSWGSRTRTYIAIGRWK